MYLHPFSLFLLLLSPGYYASPRLSCIAKNRIKNSKQGILYGASVFFSLFPEESNPQACIQGHFQSSADRVGGKNRNVSNKSMEEA